MHSTIYLDCLALFFRFIIVAIFTIVVYNKSGDKYYTKNKEIQMYIQLLTNKIQM